MGVRPEGFSLQAYADQSFGIYQDDTEDVELRISPAAAEGARRWRFHAGQTMAAEPDGTVRVSFRYEGGSTPGRTRVVTPYGVLFGRSNYLVAAEDAATGPRNWRLDRMHDIAVTARAGTKPDGFSLQGYADESFGIYQDDTEDVVVRITPEGAQDALRWRFHANQSVEPQADGSVVVRFRASGMRELAWHLFTWGDKVAIVAPLTLKDMMAAELQIACRAHASGNVVTGA
jgi:predicted DNA-binding transcriptional regulator YafY